MSTSSSHNPLPSATSVIESEVAQFDRLAHQWWDQSGPFAPFLRFNPVRLGFIRDEAARQFARDPRTLKPFSGLNLLDIGCGGGLLSEPMARLGFCVTGLDAGAENIGAAKNHAKSVGLDIDFRAETLESLCAKNSEPYDVVTCMEVLEHVHDPENFVKLAASQVRPGGLLFLATLNRTLKAHALGIFAAEYVLGWVPRGTHDWSKFLKPEALERFLDGTGLSPEPAIGVEFDLGKGAWHLGSDTSVNYMMVARR